MLQVRNPGCGIYLYAAQECLYHENSSSSSEKLQQYRNRMQWWICSRPHRLPNSILFTHNIVEAQHSYRTVL